MGNYSYECVIVDLKHIICFLPHYLLSALENGCNSESDRRYNWQDQGVSSAKSKSVVHILLLCLLRFEIKKMHCSRESVIQASQLSILFC